MRASSASSITGMWNDERLMQIARVVGTVVSTKKHRKFEGAKLLLVQPLNWTTPARRGASCRGRRRRRGAREGARGARGARCRRSARRESGASRRGNHRHHRRSGPRAVTEQELRALVREAIARHVDHRAAAGPSHAAPAFDRRHASHLLLPVERGSEGGGACLIEPTVRCNHCGYCQSYGH